MIFFAQIIPSNNNSNNEKEKEQEQELKIRVLTRKVSRINGERKKVSVCRMSLSTFSNFFSAVQVRKHQIVAVSRTLKAKGQKMHVRDDARTRTHIQQQKLDHHAKII